MTFDPHGVRDFRIGMPVIGYDGQTLGKVREVFAHYVVVDQEGEHESLDVPVHAITGLEQGKLRVLVNRTSATEVDDIETAHRMTENK